MTFFIYDILCHNDDLHFVPHGMMEMSGQASRPGRFAPRERTSGTNWIEWVGPRAGLDAVVR
jgi:hypothetical protein